MRHPILCASALALLLAPTAAAQRPTLIVDAQNRPGTDYTEVQPAIDAASDGYVLRVRDGDYEGFTVAGKALAIVGGPNVRIRGASLFTLGITVRDLPAGKEVSVAGFEVAPAISLAGDVATVSNCAGRVLLERISGSRNNGLWGTPTGSPALNITGSSQVAVSACRFSGYPAIAVTDGTLLAADSECLGGGGFAGHGEFSPGPGIAAARARAVLSRCTLRGGSINLIGGASFPQPALTGTQVDWTITGLAGTTIEAGTASIGVWSVSAIAGTGSGTIHPELVLVPAGGAPPVAPGVVLRPVPTPSLQAIGGEIGGSVRTDLFGATGDLFGLTVGVSGDRIPLGPLGDLWHDPTGFYAVAAIGVIPAGRRFALSIQVPSDNNLLGQRFVWQAIAGTAGTSFLLSNPASYVH